jgi:hypothetical protein
MEYFWRVPFTLWFVIYGKRGYNKEKIMKMMGLDVAILLIIKKS